VGFKLEPAEKRESLVKEAEALLEADTLDAVVANGVSSMGSISTRLYLVRKDQGVVELNGDKFTVAGKLLDALAGGIA
jgi:phosphopantothenoylcysteine synthetase/decarboxylase